MSNERDTDARLRDPGVDAAWRAASTEQPTPAADAAILAAARSAVRAPTQASAAPARAPWWLRWQPLAAAAGVAVLAILLVQRLPTEQASRERPPAEAALGQAAPPPPERESSDAVTAVPEPPTTQPAAPARQDAAESVAPSARALPASAAEAKSAAGDPETNASVRRVVELHDSGELVAAAEELRGLRRVRPDADTLLPPRLRAWAETVRPEGSR
jgi:hypothetical protein